MKKRRRARDRQHGGRQHLDKVGAHGHDAAVHERQLERDAVMDTMGLSGLGGSGRTIAWIVFGIIAVVAIIEPARSHRLFLNAGLRTSGGSVLPEARDPLLQEGAHVLLRRGSGSRSP
jgi:hypothetical protein